MRLLTLWLVLALGQVLGGLLFLRATPVLAQDGPLGSGQALLVASLADAVILVLIAGSMRARGWTLGLVLAGVLLLVQTGQSLIEAAVFSRDVALSAALMFGVAATAVLRDGIAAATIALLWRGRAQGASARLTGLVWKLPLIAILYVICYFTAGALIAWPSPAVRTYYAHVGEIDSGILWAVQVGRGLLWAGLAVLLIRGLAAPAWRSALLTGLAFSGFMTPQLLYPNPVMPWAVRSMHMIEVGTSNFVFGALAALILVAAAQQPGSMGPSSGPDVIPATGAKLRQAHPLRESSCLTT